MIDFWDERGGKGEKLGERGLFFCDTKFSVLSIPSLKFSFVFGRTAYRVLFSLSGWGGMEVWETVAEGTGVLINESQSGFLRWELRRMKICMVVGWSIEISGALDAQCGYERCGGWDGLSVEEWFSRRLMIELVQSVSEWWLMKK